MLEPAPRSLADLEAVIERGLGTFVEVGRALLAIRDGRLYRDEGYGDFDGYCRERWGWSRIRAHQLIGAAEVAGVLTTVNTQPPANERQARELAPLRDDPDALRETWADVRAIRGDAATAKDIRAAVERRMAAAPIDLPRVEAALDGDAQERLGRGRLRAAFAHGVAEASRLMLLDPARVADALDADRLEDALEFEGQMRAWLDRLRAAGRRGVRLVTEENE